MSARRILVARRGSWACAGTGAVVAVEEGDGGGGADDEGALVSAMANTGLGRVRGRAAAFLRRDDDERLATCGTRRWWAQHREAVDEDRDKADENAGSIEGCMTRLGVEGESGDCEVAWRRN